MGLFSLMGIFCLLLSIASDSVVLVLCLCCMCGPFEWIPKKYNFLGFLFGLLHMGLFFLSWLAKAIGQKQR